MPALTFAGGIFPPHRKSASQALPIEDTPLPSRLVIPLKQHSGAPAKPLVEVGQQVLVGTKIADADARVTASLHAPIAGTVAAIEERKYITSWGGGTCIVVEAGEEQGTAEAHAAADVTPETIRQAVREAGVVGLGGAVFPTAVKLTPPEGKPIDTAVINGCECEPCLTGDHRVMVENAQAVVDGSVLIMRAVGAEQCLIGIEDNKPDAIEAMRAAATDGVRIVPLKTKYPQGAAEMLINAVTGRSYGEGQHSSDIGVIAQNVQTAAAVHDAVRDGKPLIRRVLTVTGAVKQPKNLRARIGTPVQELIDQCGGFSRDPGKVILGGPMFGEAIPDTTLPILKGTTGIVVLGADEIEPVPREVPPCIRCGRCVRACPVALLPFQLGHLSVNQMYDLAADRYNLDTCIECGSCAYSCPAKIPLVQLIQDAKSEIWRRERANA